VAHFGAPLFLHKHSSDITVVTRDYSLFENPVTVDYFTSE
jgi:hypothetical protein